MQILGRLRNFHLAKRSTIWCCGVFASKAKNMNRTHLSDTPTVWVTANLSNYFFFLGVVTQAYTPSYPAVRYLQSGTKVAEMLAENKLSPPERN